jgi:hypothetical protein
MSIQRLRDLAASHAIASMRPYIVAVVCLLSFCLLVPWVPGARALPDGNGEDIGPPRATNRLHAPEEGDTRVHVVVHLLGSRGASELGYVERVG